MLDFKESYKAELLTASGGEFILCLEALPGFYFPVEIHARDWKRIMAMMGKGNETIWEEGMPRVRAGNSG
jgi:hypothetical protein